MTQQDDRAMLLEFAESVANHRSSNLHGCHSDVIQAARKVVIAAGGNATALGRYHEGCAEPMSWEEYAVVKARRQRERDAQKAG